MMSSKLRPLYRMLTLTTLCGFTFVGCDCNDEDALNNGGDPNTADVAPDSSSMQPDASPDLSTETDSGTTPGKTVQLKIHHNISGQSTPLANVRFVRSATQASPAQCASASDRTDSEGGLDTQGATHISYCFGQGFISHHPTTNDEILIARDDANYKNVFRFALSWHVDGTNHINLHESEKDIELDFTLPVDAFERDLAYKLLPFKRKAALIMKRGIGINLNSQGTQSPLVGPSIIFADLFRTAEPFSDHSGQDIAIPVDANGWVTAVPDGAVILSSIIKGQTKGIPTGRYTVLYDGQGFMSYGGTAEVVERTPGRDVIDITPVAGTSNQMWLRISEVVDGNHITNIRIVMPGGFCQTNPAVHVMESSACAAGEYNSFEELLQADRNAFVFNPEMLWFLKDFSTMRLGVAMESSPQTPPECKNQDGSAQASCLTHAKDWDDRPTMDALSFGSPGQHLYEETRGVPIEALIALANVANISPWIVFDPTMSDDYIEQMATYVNDNLFKEAMTYLELGNEIWNGHFLGYHYVQKQGLERGYGNGDREKAGREYYARRSVEMFDLFEAKDTSHNAYRVLSGFFRNAPLTQELLSYLQPGDIDGFGLAPYFYGCYISTWPANCMDRALTPKTYWTVETVEDVFEMLNNPDDPFSIDSLFEHVKTHSTMIKAAGFEMIMYEGGQSLRSFSVKTGDADEEATARWRATPLFTEANLDARMGDMYTDFLTRWRALDGGPIVLYTSPRGYSMFGSFGLSETLGTTRADAPKYDSVLLWQEDVEPCGSANCSNP